MDYIAMLTKKLDPPLDTTHGKVLLTFKAVRPPHHHTMINDNFGEVEAKRQAWLDEYEARTHRELMEFYLWDEQQRQEKARQEEIQADRRFLSDCLNIGIKDIPLYSSSVYVMALTRDPLLYKIGYTAQPRKRVKAIARKHKSTICYYLLSASTPEAREIEEELHHLYYRRRERFNGEIEWHRLTPQDLTVITRYFAAIATGEEF